MLKGPLGPKRPPGPYNISLEAGGGGGGLSIGSPHSLHSLMGELWRFGTSCAKFVNFFSGHSAPIFGMVVCVCFAAKTLDNFSFMAIFLASTVPTGTLSGKGVVLGATDEG